MLAAMSGPMSAALSGPTTAVLDGLDLVVIGVTLAVSLNSWLTLMGMGLRGSLPLTLRCLGAGRLRLTSPTRLSSRALTAPRW